LTDISVSNLIPESVKAMADQNTVVADAIAAIENRELVSDAVTIIKPVVPGVDVEEKAADESIEAASTEAASLEEPKVEDKALSTDDNPAIESEATVDHVEAPHSCITSVTPVEPAAEEETTKTTSEAGIESSAASENDGTVDGSAPSDTGLTADSSIVSDNGAPGPSGNQKPLLAFTAPPVMGHTSPLLRLATEMTQRGYEVIFMSTVQFKEAIVKAGAEFYESKTPFCDFNYLKSRHTLPPGLPTLCADMENMFIKPMLPRSAEFGSLLELVRERDPTRDVVVVTETMSLAPMPFIYGAPLPKGYDVFPKTINISTVPIMLLSIDTGFTGPCLPPDASESGRARNKIMNEMLVRGPMGGTDKVFHESLKSVGATSVPKVFFQNAWLESYDTTLQLCVPGLEYPRSDLHLSIRYSGALPKRPLPSNFQYPSWWSEIKANAGLPVDQRKKVVAVAQGTVALDYADLILPTIQGLAHRSDVITVAILGVKGATLESSEDFTVPDNVRIIDYFSYDAILEYADVFLTNGGYGGLSHGVLNGVPMILAGTTEDKAEVCARGEYAGFAINLRVQRPTSTQVGDACNKIFTTPSYKHRALRLQQENEDLDAIAIFERQVGKYAKTQL
jgi:hypothetical protein